MLIVWWWFFFFFFFFALKQNPSENIENNLKEKAAHLVTGILLEKVSHRPQTPSAPRRCAHRARCQVKSGLSGEGVGAMPGMKFWR